ncbi:MAG: tyrosine-type recombinase/integrase, partial [Deltaproteobacteria bacterium]
MTCAAARKTGQPRRIPIGRKLGSLLDQAVGSRTEGPIFLSPAGKAWTVPNLSRADSRLRNMAGLPRDLVPYLARHECGTKICREKGIEYARRLLGHASIATTQRYMHLDDRELAEAQDLAEYIADGYSAIGRPAVAGSRSGHTINDLRPVCGGRRCASMGAAFPHHLSEDRMADEPFTDCITDLTPTVCKLMGVPPPKTAASSNLESIGSAADRIFSGQSAEKCLIFCPDAIGAHLWSHPGLDFGKILKNAPIRLGLRSVIPPKTPVCFASMFTGAPPEVHGIRRYERPVLSCDTLFDAVLRAKKRVAIVAVRNSSIDLIFRGRALDYFSEAYDSEVLDRALQLVRDTDHDLIIVYQQEYDDTLHRTTPLSDECL